MNYNDSTRTGKPHPNDGTAMRRYSQTYAYDAVGNLLEVVHTPSSGTGWTRTYTIDSASNRLDENSIGSNAVTAESYTYDARGNIITGFNHLTSLTYNEDNRLEKVVLADTNITSYYQYDGSGQRVRKVTKDNNSNGYKQIRKYVGSWEVYKKIDSNNDVVSQKETLHIMDDRARVALIDSPVIDNTSTEVQLLRYQFSNHLQTATLELDKVAAIISYEEYYPFGSTSFQSGRNTTEVSRKRYRYTGKEKDEETGLYYHGARYYVPWLCRWCAVDPKQSEMPDWSSYNYGFNNPIKWTDSTGMQPDNDEKCTSHHNSHTTPSNHSGSHPASKPTSQIKDHKIDASKIHGEVQKSQPDASATKPIQIQKIKDGSPTQNENDSKKNQLKNSSNTAKQLLDSKRISFATKHASNVPDNANASQNIKDAAQGKLASRSAYGTAPGGQVELNPKLLSGLLKLSESYKMNVSELAGGSHTKTTSKHYSGISADINIINGLHVGDKKFDLKSFKEAATKLGFQVGDESNLKKGPHIHLDMKR